MLKLYPPRENNAAGQKDLASAFWIDLLEGTPEEIRNVEAILGSAVPSRWALSEIEPSNRLRMRNEVLFMSMPSVSHRGLADPAVAPLGFVLSADRLITVRFTPLPAFDAVAAKFDPGRTPPKSGLEVFIELADEIVDRIADGLEHIAEELNTLSASVFHKDNVRGRNPNRATQLLRMQLRQLGRLGDRASELRDGLMGLGRVVNYVDQFGGEWSGDIPKARLASARQDLNSLEEYEEHLANKTQFVLDAVVGLIGIAQNDIFKVLTIVSIVGIPPTLVAGIYGMNFEHMPELKWALGYEFGWAFIIVSAVIPLVWFKIRGWF
jgi:magnesium transporter